MSTIHPLNQTSHDLIIVPPAERMSETEFDRWAQTIQTRVEWVDGEIIVMSPAAKIHDELFQWLMRILADFVEERDLGQVAGPEFVVRFAIQKTRRIPDLMFVSKQNLARFKPTYLDGPPDLAIEIVSPDSQARDWREKYIEYEAAGVREYWVVDPVSQSIEVSHLDANGKYAKGSLKDGKLISHVIAGFYLRPEWFWTVPRPRVKSILAELGVALS